MFDIDHLYLSSYNYNVSELGVSTTEGLNDKEREQNGLIDCMMTILKDVEYATHSLYKSIDNDTQLVESKAKLIPETGSTKHIAYNFGALHEQTSRKNDYITGKTGIAPFALNVTGQVLTYLCEVEFRSSIFTAHSPIDHLHHLVDNNYDSIASWLSAFINAHVDIVKDPYISKLNVNKFTYNTLNLLVRCGIGEAGVWFLSQPVIRDMAKAKDVGDSKYLSVDKDELMKKEVEKYGIDCSESTIEIYSSSPDKRHASIRTNNFNEVIKDVETLRLIATHPGAKKVTVRGKEVDVAEYQAKVFYAWKTLEKYSRALSNLVQYTKIDTKKHGKSLLEIARYMDGYNKLFNPSNPELSVFDIRSLERLKNETWIDIKTQLAISLPQLILGSQTFNGHGKFVDSVIRFADSVNSNKDEAVDKDVITSISKGFITAIKSKYIVNWARQCLGKNDADIKGLFVGNYSMNKRLNMLKMAITSNPKYARLGENNLIKQLIIQNPNDSRALATGGVVEQPSFITVTDNVDGSRLNENILIDGWYDLLSDPDEVVRSFAQDLILYSFLTSGEYKGWNKLFKYVPYQWLIGQTGNTVVGVDGIQHNSFSDYVSYCLSKEMPDLESIKDDFIANNFMDNKIVKKMTMKDKDGNSNFMTSNRGNVMIANLTSERELEKTPVYICMKKDGVNGYGAEAYEVYKRIGTMSSSVKGLVYPIYAVMKKKGYSGSHNNTIYEYEWNFNYGENTTSEPQDGDFKSAYDRVNETAQTYYNKHISDWNALLRTLGEAFEKGIKADPKPSTTDSVKPKITWEASTQYYSRESVKNDPETLYIFTDNTDRTSGGNQYEDGWYKEKYGEGGYGSDRNPTSALIRGLENAVPISTMRYFYKNHPGMTHPKFDPNSQARWHDKDFDEFKRVFDDEIETIKRMLDSGKYKKLVSPVGDQGKSPFFGSKLTEITSERTPIIHAYMEQKFNELWKYVLDMNKEEDLNIQQSNTKDLVITNNASKTKEVAAQIGGVDTLRHPDANGMHFGNPFSHTNYTGVQKVMPNVKEAVIAFEQWLRGTAYLDIEPERRQWIVDQINSGTLDGKQLVYYTDKIPDNSYGRSTYDYNEAPNHAHILQKLINEHVNQNIPSEEEINADRDFHNLNDTSLDSEIEIINGIKYYHKPFHTKTGKTVKWSVVNNFLNKVLDLFADFSKLKDLPYSGHFVTESDGIPRPSTKVISDKPMNYAIPYYKLKNTLTTEYDKFTDFINGVNNFLRDLYGEQISADFTTDQKDKDGKPSVFTHYSKKYNQLFVYDKLSKSMVTSSKEVYDIITDMIEHPEIGEFLSDMSFDLGYDVVDQVEYNLAEFIDELNEYFENNMVPLNIITTNTALLELFPEMSVENIIGLNKNYELFSEEELKQAAEIKKQCKGL